MNLDERRKRFKRERTRVHDICLAYKELGKSLPDHLTGRKVETEKTKLTILQEAVQVINALEDKIISQNIDTGAESVKRREEEKCRNRGTSFASGGAGQFEDDYDDDSSDGGQGK
ncbi:protein daughterless-like isoform X2 [Sycon ciliatum]|uniref:protein daughterless-like isoform X2 n=1 Tax=Sycon ciliatum TaxID=27933 RepID=UPI0031F633C6